MLALMKINDGNLERSEWLGGAHLDEGNFLLAGHRITIAGGKAFVANRSAFAARFRITSGSSLIFFLVTS